MKISVTRRLRALASNQILWGKLVLTLCIVVLTNVHAHAQNITVRGRVTNDAGQGVPNASVTVKETKNGVTSNTEGNFEIQAPSNGTLVISSVGFGAKEIKIGGQTSLNISLSTAGADLEQVVVVGYGTQRKKDVTGAVSTVNLETMANAPNTNIGQYLQGTVPGLNVGIGTSAGATPPINIRGRVTLNGNQTVLIIVDGIQYTGSLSSINPDDIATIDVLKDASATAVYGAQGANGVILITSRKGRYNQRPRVAFSSAYSTQSPYGGDDLKPMNREEYLQAIKEAFWRVGNVPSANDAFLAPDYTQPNPNFKLENVVDASMTTPGRTALLPNDYDWRGEGTQKGSILENTLSISGGGDRITYLLSGGLVDQNGFIKNDLFKRKNIRANLEIKPVNWWRIGLQSSGSFVNQDGNEPGFGQLNIFSPLLVPYDSAGNVIPSPTNTVLGSPFTGYYVTDYDRIQYYFANIYSDMDIPFIKGLNYRMNFGNNLRNDQHYYASKFDANQNGRAYKENQSYYDYTFDNILNYNRTFGRHDFGLTALYGAIERQGERTFAEGTNFARLNLGYNNIGGAEIKNITTTGFDEALNYQMGRLNYKYNEKYILTATVRRDGFSGFAKNFKYAVLPSVSMAWIISSENFMQSFPAINFLKLRAGYGEIGNQTTRYFSIARVNTNESYVYGDVSQTAFGQQVSALGNDDLKWERTKGINLGVDFTVLNNRLTGNLEYYNTNTNDLLFSVQIPVLSGFGNFNTNLGKINNKGWEVGLTGNILKGKDFNWTSTFNIWGNNNKIKSLTGVDANGDGKEDDLISSGLFIGKSINAIFDYQEAGIYQLGETRLPGFQEGSLKVVDLDKNGSITAADRMFLGRQEAAYRMSLYNLFSYKGFSLSFFLNSVQGGKDGYLGNNVRLYFREDNYIRNNDLRGVDYWSPRNPNGKYPRIISGSRSTVEPPMFEDRSFVRLQDVSLGYSFSPKILTKIKAQSINFYVSGKNVHTWTDWQGWDPEALVRINNNDVPNGMRTDGRPVLRAFTAGLRITY